MVTAVGLSAPETAASVRAAMMRFNETSFRDKQFEPLVAAEIPREALPELDGRLQSAAGMTARERRLLQLCSAAIGECLAPIAALGQRPGLMLALPETSTALQLDSANFVNWLAYQADVFDPQRSAASGVGRAGGLIAIQRAVDVIRSGQASLMIVGGVDSYLDLYVLGTMDLDKRVKSSSHLDGFIPGEGAGFLLIADHAAASRAGLPVLAKLSAVAQGFEAGHLYSAEPYRGDGLAQTLQQLAATGALNTPVREVFSSMNGENFFAKEWGVSYLRNKGRFDPEHGMYHPADCFGDTGAACGPLMVGLAALGIARGYHASPVLVYCSSDHGERAALVVSGA